MLMSRKVLQVPKRILRHEVSNALKVRVFHKNVLDKSSIKPGSFVCLDFTALKIYG